MLGACSWYNGYLLKKKALGETLIIEFKLLDLPRTACKPLTMAIMLH